MKCRHLLLRDTRGNFYLGVKLPTPKSDRYKKGRKQYFKEYNKRPEVRQRHNINSRKWTADNSEKSREIKRNWRDKNPQYHTDYSRQWKRNLPFEQWQYYRDQKQEYMKGYYQRNRQHILDYHKAYYRKNKKRNSISYQ